MAKIRNRYNQAPYMTKDNNGKVTTSQLDITNESQEVSPFPAGDHKAPTNHLKPYFNSLSADHDNLGKQLGHGRISGVDTGGPGPQENHELLFLSLELQASRL